MKRSGYMVRSAKLAALCIFLALAVSCAGNQASGPGAPSEGTPMAEEAAKLLYSLQMKDGGKDPVSPDSLKPLGNTTWLVTSVNPKPSKPFASMILKFQPDGKLIETTVYEGRSEQNQTFSYQVIGSTLLIIKPKSEVNARFKMEGSLLVIDTGDTSILLQRIKAK